MLKEIENKYPVLFRIIEDIDFEMGIYVDQESKQVKELLILRNSILEDYEVVAGDIQLINDVCDISDLINEGPSKKDLKKLLNKKLIQETSGKEFKTPVEAWDYLVEKDYLNIKFFINDDDAELISESMDILNNL